MKRLPVVLALALSIALAPVCALAETSNEVSIVVGTNSGELVYSGVFEDVPAGTSAMDLFERVAGDGHYINDGGYVSSVTDTSGNEYAEITSEPYSGWLYYTNGDFPSVGMGEYEVSPGDAIVIGYMQDGVYEYPETWDGAFWSGDVVASESGEDIDNDGEIDAVPVKWSDFDHGTVETPISTLGAVGIGLGVGVVGVGAGWFGYSRIKRRS